MVEVAEGKHCNESVGVDNCNNFLLVDHTAHRHKEDSDDSFHMPAVADRNRVDHLSEDRREVVMLDDPLEFVLVVELWAEIVPEMTSWELLLTSSTVLHGRLSKSKSC